MNMNEKRLLEANIKMQDEKNELKYQFDKLTSILQQIETYIQINHDKDNKVNAQSILDIIGEYYGR